MAPPITFDLNQTSPLSFQTPGPLAFLSPANQKGPMEVGFSGLKSVGESLASYAVLKITCEFSKTEQDAKQLDVLGAQLGAQLGQILDWSLVQLARFTAAVKKAWPHLLARARQSFLAWMQGILALLPVSSRSLQVKKALPGLHTNFPKLLQTIALGPQLFKNSKGAEQLAERLAAMRQAYPQLPLRYLGDLGRYLISHRAAALTQQWGQLTRTLLSQPNSAQAPQLLKKMRLCLQAMRQINTVLHLYLGRPLIKDLDARQAALVTWTDKKPAPQAHQPQKNGLICKKPRKLPTG